MTVREYKKQRNKIAKENPKYKEGDFVKINATTVRIELGGFYKIASLSRTINGKTEYMDYGELTGKVLSVDVRSDQNSVDVKFLYDIYVFLDCDQSKEKYWLWKDGIEEEDGPGFFLHGVQEKDLDLEDENVVRSFTPTPRVIHKHTCLTYDDGTTKTSDIDVDPNGDVYPYLETKLFFL